MRSIIHSTASGSKGWLCRYFETALHIRARTMRFVLTEKFASSPVMFVMCSTKCFSLTLMIASTSGRRLHV